MRLIVFLMVFSGMGFLYAHATSYGKRLEGKIIEVSGKPAICIPDNLKTAFPLGWVVMTQSSKTPSPYWGVALNPGTSPLLLKAGDCVVFDEVPDNYTDHLIGRLSIPIKFEVNEVYSFRITDADRPTNSYGAVFCVSQSASGQLVYLQYIRLPDGATMIPECDAGRRKRTSGS